ncbi:MAG TPA: class I SAM-dependent methyltransferase [Candidatus Udaeobacter sp.]|nr:class I SAM-dependent methyltransferase [Candidatus Udaeobacter sp.]
MDEGRTRDVTATALAPGTPYDAVPYESHPFARTHISHLHMLGRLHGMAPADFRRCRVLELGGASGGNLIPMAMDFPDSEFLGIDLSARQIEAGNVHVANLGLKNIVLRTASIMDVGADYGQFDYIVCHGVFSWVPPAVQDKILSIFRERLKPRGVAVFSYNAMPGWHLLRTLREMMLYHGERFADPLERAREARKLLHFLGEFGDGDKKHPFRQLLRDELDQITKKADWYLLHDYMEENNYQFYFHEIVEKLKAQGLLYIGDADLRHLRDGRLPQDASETLAASDDPVRREQYMDFARMRGFRSTVVCHENVKVELDVPNERILDCFWSTALQPREALELRPDALGPPLTFAIPGRDISLTTVGLATAAYYTLCRQPKYPVRPASVVKQAMERFGIADGPGLRAALLDHAEGLLAAGAIGLYERDECWLSAPPQLPEASRLARYQATYSTWVTSLRHSREEVDPLMRIVLQYLDGQHGREAIAGKVLELAAKGMIEVETKGGPGASPGDTARRIALAVDDALKELAQKALLLA